MSLIYTVPWGFLSAVLLVFGRLSSDNEITSFRVAGLSLVRLAVPVFVIGALLSLLSLWLNTTVVPRSMATTMQLVTPNEMRGRVASVNSIFIGSSNEIGGLESGGVAQAFTPVISVVSGGIGTLLVVALWAGLFPGLRRFGGLAVKEDKAEVVV